MTPDSLSSLAEPQHSRWQPLRMGLVNLYYYDVEEFRFCGGHLMLRGNNGTGKSKVLSLTLPFLLDGNLSASRVEPDGDRNKRMEWNLLMGGRHERRIGYTWLEFGRREASGAIRTLTLGCGLRAVAGRPSVDSWFFVTDQRVGEDLWLTTADRSALTKDRLMEALGARGQVFDTAQTYRRAVDEQLFRLGPERYAALVDTLIQLRQPQLSKQPNEQRLSDALTDALPPLDRVALEDVAEAMSELDNFRRELEELETMRGSVDAFAQRYRRYAQVATRRRARWLRQAQTEFDNASRELKDASAELDSARAQVARCTAEEQRLDAALAAGEARLKVLRADPAMRDAVQIDAAREHAVRCQQNMHHAQQRAETAQRRLEEEERSTERRREDSAVTGKLLTETGQNAAVLAKQTGVDLAHREALGDIRLPEGVMAAPEHFTRKLAAALREAERRRREQIGVIRKRLREWEQAERARARAQDARVLRADAFDAAEQVLAEAAQGLRQVGGQLLSDWRHHLTTLKALKLPHGEDVLEALEVWTESLDGPNPVRASLDEARQTFEDILAAQEAQAREGQRALTAEQTLLREEYAMLEAGLDRAPPKPYTRGADVRAQRPGAELWKLVDFAPHVAQELRAGLEAALEAAGLLDAWVTPAGELLISGTHDVTLVGRPSVVSAPLSEWLIPALPTESSGTAVSAQTVSAILHSIACADSEPTDAEAWVSPQGAFRVGPARGAWMKPAAHYIGHAARTAARRERLAQLTTRLEEVESAITALDAECARLAEARRAARDECAGAPSDEGLLRIHAQRTACERQRRDAQARLGEAESHLAVAEHALAHARGSLESDARDLRLPKEPVALGEIESLLNDYRAAGLELVNSIDKHRRALAELGAQQARLLRAGADCTTTASEVAEHRVLLLAAEETLATLKASVGKRVDELLADIAKAEQAQTGHRDALQYARQTLNTASGQRGIAEQKCADFGIRLEERTQARRQCIEGLQTFATQTGLLSVALPELAMPVAEAPWGVEEALTVARRAEQALTEVTAEDQDWHRIQGAIGRELTELQSAMSAQGHSATAEVSDYGVVVRIVYQQRPERPDTLYERLGAELDTRRVTLSAQERTVLEMHLQKEIAASLQKMIQGTERQVTAINTELHARPTSTGMRYRLNWQVLPDEGAQSFAGLAQARQRLLRTRAEAWSEDDRRLVGEFLQTRIDAERAGDEQATIFEGLSRALDYRRWHRFRVERQQDGKWKPLAGPASSGERALGLTVPLFAAASSHYGSADPHAPRLVLLDEAFAGVDDEARGNCMALIREFDLDFVMTSEREWGCYAQLPGLSICQLTRREGMDAVHVSHWTWDGKTRRREETVLQRFPDAQAGEPEAMT